MLARLLVVLVTVTVALGAAAHPALGAVDAGERPAPAVSAGVDLGGADDVVEVQLVVLGVVIAAVFVVGTLGYLLRWRLGRTAYTPPADSGHH